MRLLCAIIAVLLRPRRTAELAKLRREKQALWRRVAAGDDLPEKVKRYLEGL